MSMKQIETLVFDYGGVIVNIDDASVVKAMEIYQWSGGGSRDFERDAEPLPQRNLN